MYADGMLLGEEGDLCLSLAVVAEERTCTTTGVVNSKNMYNMFDC